MRRTCSDRASPSPVLAVALLAGGCLSEVGGVEGYDPGPCVEVRCASGQLCMDGVCVNEPVDGDVPAAEEAPDSGRDAEACDETVACVLVDGSASTAPCHDAEPLAACAPGSWRWDECGGGAPIALFFDPPSGSGEPLRSVTLVGADLSDLRLSVDGLCPGAPIAECELAGGGAVAHVWTDFAGADVDRAGQHRVVVFAEDTGAPCWIPDGGRELMHASFER